MKRHARLWAITSLLVALCATLSARAQIVALNDPIGTIYQYQKGDPKDKNFETFMLISKSGNKYTLRGCDEDEIEKVRKGEKSSKSSSDEPDITIDFEVKDGVLHQSATGMISMIERELQKELSGKKGKLTVKLTPSGELYSIPLRGKVGDTFPESTFKVKAKVAILGITVKYQNISNKIIRQEQVTTPLGTFDCIVVELKNKLNVRMLGFFGDTQEETMTLWVNPKVGVVKEVKLSREKGDGDKEPKPEVRQLVAIVRP